MQSTDWYYKQLEINNIVTNKLSNEEQHRLTAFNLTNHSLYGNLGNWYDITAIFGWKSYWRKPGNYIQQLYQLYNLYKLAQCAGNVETLYQLITMHYKSLINKKIEKINVYLLLNSFMGLNCDVISVINHYYTLLFLWC